jgi:hypothetical protein
VIPAPRQPRNAGMTLLASAICRRQIKAARFDQRRTGLTVEVQVMGHRYGQPRIGIPRLTFIALWNQCKLPEEFDLYATSVIYQYHGRRVQEFIRNKIAVIRVGHYYMEGRGQLWIHDVMEVE